MKTVFSFLFSLLAITCFGQLTTPTVNAADIFITKATVSVYPNPADGADSFVFQRATVSDFSDATQIYAGGNQVVFATGMTGNTQYYFRVKAIRKSDAVESAWATKSVKTFWSPCATSVGGNRIATQADVDNTTLNPDGFIEVGDYLYVGANGCGTPETGGYQPTTGNYDYWGSTLFLQTPPALAAGKKICIIGNRGYDYIQIDMVNNPGTPDNYRVITNIGGQVRGRLWLTNCKYVKVTGKYDPVHKTGSSQYLGWDTPDWKNLYGSFGFQIHANWEDGSSHAMTLNKDSHNDSLMYIQAGEGGFASLQIKNDGTTYDPLDSIVLYRALFADSHGEGLYGASTQTQPQTQLNNLTVKETMWIRNGGNSFQLGQIGEGGTIQNNVFIMGGFEWSNQFQKFQDQMIQFGLRRNTLKFDNNIVQGGAGDFLNHILEPYTAGGDVNLATDTSSMSNNLWSGTRSYGGGYVNVKTGFDGVTNFNNNYFRKIGSGAGTSYYETLYTNVPPAGRTNPRTQVLWVQPSGGKLKLNMGGNTYDNSIAAGGSFATKQSVSTDVVFNDDGTNTRVAALPAPHYVNYMDFDTTADYANVETWTARYSPDWNASNRAGTGFSTLVTNSTVASSTSFSIPTTHPTTVTVTIPTEMVYPTGEKAVINNGSNSVTGTITSYDSGTGVLVLSSTANSGTGTFSSWTVKRDIASIIMPRVYNQNEIVRYKGRFYKSKLNGNAGNTPPLIEDANWKIMVFSNGSIKPPNDVRLYSDNLYATQGIGLTQTYTAAQQIPIFKIRRGGKIRFKHF